MALPSYLQRVLEVPAVYHLWQAPFVRAKFAPILQHNDLARVKRVLDIGCGPGTNCKHFRHAHYTGIDVNPGYISYARRRHAMDFQVRDATTDVPDGRYDFVLLNSLLHHLDDQAALRVLRQSAAALDHNGSIHVIELVLPERQGLPRLMATRDRGDYPRPLERWRSMFCQYFEPQVFRPYTIGLAGIPLWNLVYFKGKTLR